MSELLKLPIGIDSFEKIRKENFFYVDKTKLIEQLLERWGEVNLFTRPRRFGKTLNMSMLRHFFEIGTDKSLFNGLYISSNKSICEKYMGKFPVIFLSLKGVDGLSFEDARYQLIELIATEAERFHFLAESTNLTENDKARYHGLIALRNGQYAMESGQLISSLWTLTQLLYKHYGQKAIILIDEYDVPLDKAFHTWKKQKNGMMVTASVMQISIVLGMSSTMLTVSVLIQMHILNLIGSTQAEMIL